MNLETIRRSVIAALFAAAGSLALSCSAVEALASGTPAPAAPLPEASARAARAGRRSKGWPRRPPAR